VFIRRIPVWKRAMDLIGAVVALTLCAPVMLLVAAYIRIVSPGPVFFRQERVGYRGKLFTFLKFRTMKPGNDVSTHREHLRELIRNDTPMWKLDTVNDPRIIPGGNILRKLSLDELPQFINVLRGEMSLVGPRPCIPYEAEEYLRWHTRRFDVYPGLSGLWQVSGKNRLSFKEMIRLDIAYANNMSLLLDLAIILRTFPTLVGMALEKHAPLFRQGFSRSTRPADPGTV
jgi:lipopolysaccharide/colanic/teichoic acid biosynthesis glycosyltransferase